MLDIRVGTSLEWWQAALWPGASLRTSGSTRAQISVAIGQRGWKRHPEGTFDGSGDSPFRIRRRRVRSRGGSGRGIAGVPGRRNFVQSDANFLEGRFGASGISSQGVWATWSFAGLPARDEPLHDLLSVGLGFAFCGEVHRRLVARLSVLEIFPPITTLFIQMFANLDCEWMIVSHTSIMELERRGN
jgi:hypothetical protein